MEIAVDEAKDRHRFLLHGCFDTADDIIRMRKLQGPLAMLGRRFCACCVGYVGPKTAAPPAPPTPDRGRFATIERGPRRIRKA